MSTFRAEILGRVPYGLTVNDVFASIQSMMREADPKATVSKRRLAGDMISLIVTFKSESETEARKSLRYAATGVTGFSSDTVGFRSM